MLSSGKIPLLLSIVFSLAQHSAAQVNYTCLASAAISTSSSQAAVVGSCLNKANGALTTTSIKACVKSTKTKDKTAKKPQALFYKCLNAYWKTVTALSKKNSSISTAIASCLASTGSYDSCKLATIVGTSNAALAKKATKADAKWNGKKCAGVLTPSGCSGTTISTTTATSVTTTNGGGGLTTTPSTSAATTVATSTAVTSSTSTTTAAAVATTTAPIPCSVEFCQPQCVFQTCNTTLAAAMSDKIGKSLKCTDDFDLPTTYKMKNGTLAMSFYWDYLCGADYAYYDAIFDGSPVQTPFVVEGGSLTLLCTPGTGATSWSANSGFIIMSSMSCLAKNT